ncbi:MAG: hypothetical protein J6N53_05090, partial [Lachnospiraceae bacterium]|nr:hypothetical protein [Lachnospiraceae bacterium]
MTGKRLGKRILSGAMAFIMAASTMLATPIRTKADGIIPKQMDSASLVNYDYLLGRAVDFGITANKLVFKTHMETTFATNEFVREGGSNSDVDFIKGTAQFLIGGVGATKSGEVKNVVFGGTTASCFNIEASPEVLGDYTHNNGEGVTGGKDIGQIHFNADVPSVVVNKSTATKDNVDRILTNAKSRSLEISNRAKDPAYVIDYRGFADINGNHITLDFTDPVFENKVIYVQVDDTLAKAMAESAALKIKKNSSTVIAFNIENGITNKKFYGDSSENTYSGVDAFEIQKIQVSVDGGNSWIGTETGNSNLAGAAVVDREICQKLIWNVRTSDVVSLNICAGTVLAPYCKDAIVTGSSAGWVVAPRVTVDAGEWHYIFQRGSQDTIQDGNGEIHFAARKAFTTDYTASGEPVEDKSVKTSAGTYSFQFYKCADSSYSSPVPYGDAVTNQDTNKIHFPTLTFNSADNGKTYYYLIRENGAGETVTDHGVKVEKSTGEIQIALTVSSKDSHFNYTVSTKTILGNGVVYKSNVDIGMSGVEFSLGAFFNKIITDEVAPTGTDVYISKQIAGAGSELPGAKLTLSGKNGNDTIVMNMSSISVIRGEGASDPVQRSYQIEFVSGSTPTLIKNLPDGVYTLTEERAPKGYVVADEITFEIKDGKVVGTNDNKVVMIDEEAKSDIATYTVNISKRIINQSDELPGATLRIVQYGVETGDANATDFSKVTLTQGGKDITTTADVSNCGSIEYLSGTEETVVQGLKPGSYVLYEITAPNGYEQAENIGFTIDANGKVMDADGKELPDGRVIMEDAPAPAKTYTVTISKQDINGSGELEGAKLTITQKSAEDEWTDFSKVELNRDGKEISANTRGDKSVNFTSGTAVTKISGLTAGKYTLTETTAPDGYEVAEDIDFTVDANGNVKVGGETVSVVKMLDAPKAAPVPETGKLVITKTIEGDVTKEEAEGALQFTITTTVDGKTNYVKADGSLTTEKTSIGLKSFSYADGKYT